MPGGLRRGRRGEARNLMRRIVPRESRDLDEAYNKILRSAQDDWLAQVRFLLTVEMTGSTTTASNEVISHPHPLPPPSRGRVGERETG